MFPRTLSNRKPSDNSERHFYWCCASNKAENLKFKRLSEGIDSCAHVQALVFKKEERKILSLLENFEREKLKYENEQNNKNIYRKFVTRQKRSNSDATYKFSPNPSVLTLESVSQSSEKPKPQFSLALYSSSITSNRNKNLPSNIDSKLKRQVAVKEVIPFYLQRDYRFKNYFNAQKNKSTDYTKYCSEPDLYSRSSNLNWLILDQQKNSWTSENDSKTQISVFDIRRRRSASTTPMLSSQCSIELGNASSSSFKSLQFPTKNSSIPLISTQSNLTPIERHELLMYRNGRSGEDKKLVKVLHQSQNKSGNFSNENSVKLKNILIKNLRKVSSC